MQEASSTIESLSSITQVSTDLRPADEKLLKDRSLFLATATGIFAKNLLEDYINHCTVGLAAKNITLDLKADIRICCLKEIVCISLLLTLLGQDERNSDWLGAYFRETWTHTDSAFPVPTARAILEQYGEFPIDELAEIASMNICHQLGLGLTASDASIYLASKWTEAEAELSELLFFSLSGTEDEFQHYIATSL